MAQFSKACCTIPPIISKGYGEKGRYETIGGIKTYVTGPPSAKHAILVVYDIFGFFPQTLQGADILALSDKENPYRVFVPDFFQGKAANISWYPPTTDEHQNALGAFFGGVGAPTRAIARIPDIVKAFRATHPSIQDIYALGMCWGGKVVTLSSTTHNLFKAVAQVHPAMLDPADAKDVKVPMCILASKDEPAEDVSAYKASLNIPNYVETFPDQIHGWMAARADLEDPDVREKYRQGYQTVLDFFGGRLTASSGEHQATYQIVLWPVNTSEAATRLVNFIESIPSKSKRDGQPNVLASHAGATRAPVQRRTSKVQGFNVTSILTFKSEDDAVFFVTQDSVHNEMIKVVEKDLFKTPTVSIFRNLNTAFHPPRVLGDETWAGRWE